MTELGDCPLCGRGLVGGSSVNQHHLVPRSRNGRDTVALHRICHAAIHATLSEKELERQYNTIELVMLSVISLFGFINKTIDFASGTSSERRSKRLAFSSSPRMLKPVMLPLGRAKLATKP